MANNSRGQFFTCREIIDRCGGTMEVPYQVGKTQITIYEWARNGIPEKHWPWFIEQGGVTAEQIFNANQSARQRA